MFVPETPFAVYDRDAWWSDAWDPLAYGIPYDFKKSFFVQFRKLMEQTPMPAVFNGNSVRSEYCNHVGDMKDCYLVFASYKDENVSYATMTYHSKDSYDLLRVSQGELCYESIGSVLLHTVFFSQNVENCMNSKFLIECGGCSNCFGCSNLRNKSYYFFNEPHSKEEYTRKLKELDLGSYKKLEEVRQRFEDVKLHALRKYANVTKVENVTGDDLINVGNCKNCFVLHSDVRNCKYLMNGGMHMTDSYDCYGAGDKVELLYEAVDSGIQARRLFFDVVVWGSSDVQYSYNCHGCESCFGCIGLRNKQYCILNKQYTKEEYEELAPRIIRHMNEMPYKDNAGRVYRYGEFFPTEISPFVYNETIAQDYFPLSREAAEENGFLWRGIQKSAITPTVKNDALPDHIKDVHDAITKEIIACGSCSGAYRILKQELSFLKHFNIALPRLCPECRYKRRLAQVNPPKLHPRACMCQGTLSEHGTYRNTAQHFHGDNPCRNEFETTYTPERPEIVYCEACYNAEVV